MRSKKNIESLFLRLDILDSDEINMRGGIKKIPPDIESMDKTVSGMIKQEESRVNNLGQQLDDVRQNNKIFDSEIERLNQTIKPGSRFFFKGLILMHSCLLEKVSMQKVQICLERLFSRIHHTS